MSQLDAGAAPVGVARCIGARDVQRVERHVGGDHVLESPFRRERERDGARPGADVHGDAATLRYRETKHDLDELLRLGTRNEHALVDVEREVAKGRAAGGILERRAAGSTLGGMQRGAASDADTS